MKKHFVSIVAVASISFVLIVQADDAHHPDEQKPAAAEAGPGDQNKITPATAAPKPKQQPSASAAGVPREMMENVDKMQELVGRLAKTSDPKQRERLLHEHMTLVQEQMRMTKQMAVPGMMMSMSDGQMPMEMCKRMMEHKESAPE